MSAEDLAKGIALLEDPEVQAQVADGDLSSFAGLDLTEEEAGLIEGAASEYPEVIGHDIRAGLLNLNMGLKIDQKITVDTQDVTVNKAKTAEKAYTQMDGYIRQ